MKKKVLSLGMAIIMGLNLMSCGGNSIERAADSVKTEIASALKEEAAAGASAKTTSSGREQAPAETNTSGEEQTSAETETAAGTEASAEEENTEPENIQISYPISEAYPFSEDRAWVSCHEPGSGKIYMALIDTEGNTFDLFNRSLISLSPILGAEHRSSCSHAKEHAGNNISILNRK